MIFKADQAIADVTGDGRPDTILLTGTKTVDSPFVQNITLTVKDGSTGQVYTIRLPEPAGYNPRLVLADFTGSGYQDILVQIDSGGSGAITYDDVYHYENGKFRHIFNSEHFSQQWKYTVDFLPDYKLRVTALNTNKTYTIDIRGRGKDYLNQIYNPDGTLIKPVQGFVDPVSGLYPVDNDRDGKYSLMAFQGVSGLYHADRYGYMVSLLGWNGRGWTLQDQWFAVEGM
ncbi:VCBS repeat-containing protein [Paenibacillus pinistramenti]|uniref:VCBS repeat-containing protein n=1 Tax=Paenibacillus pinistramenti TaxID=1768003 RepID=UPI001109B322|nr:VCBS repeat-containing protein [Paenibacillus pinistramenti]